MKPGQKLTSITSAIIYGYGDGYPRAGSEKAFVVIHGKKATIVGSMCMDHCIADVTDIPGTQINDEVLLYDTDSSSPVCPAVVAGFAGLSKNSSLTMLASRVPKVYIKDGKTFALEPLSGNIEEI